MQYLAFVSFSNVEPAALTAALPHDTHSRKEVHSHKVLDMCVVRFVQVYSKVSFMGVVKT